MARTATKKRPAIDEGTIVIHRIVPARVVALAQVRRNLKGRHGDAQRAQLKVLVENRWHMPFALASIPIDALNYQDAIGSAPELIDPERVKRALRYARMDTPLPPAFVTYNARSARLGIGKGYVADGNHRVLAAALRGNHKALAYIPLEDLDRLAVGSARIGLTTGVVDLSKPRKAVAVRNPARRKTPARRHRKRTRP